MKVSFRPHHFLCTLGFQGKGYSLPFVENYTRLVENLHDNSAIEVVAKGDSICNACPHLKNDACEQEDKIQSLDDRHSKILDVKPGDVLTWAEAKQRLKDNMTLNAFEKACEGCEWQPMGICEGALKRLLEKGA